MKKSILITFLFIVFMFKLIFCKPYIYQDSLFIVTEFCHTKPWSSVCNDTVTVSPDINILRQHLKMISRVMEIQQPDTSTCIIDTNVIFRFPVRVKIRKRPDLRHTDYYFYFEYHRGYVFTITDSNQFFSFNLPRTCKGLVDTTKSHITESDAVVKARTYLSGILQIFALENEVDDYDSIFVSRNWDENETKYHNYQEYSIHFRCRNKNDVLDTRTARIKVSLITGEIIGYHGDLFRMFDHGYRPKITKEMIVKFLTSKYTALQSGEIIILDMFLVLSPHQGNKRWMWFVDLSGKVRNFSGTMGGSVWLDSETGQILNTTLE